MAKQQLYTCITLFCTFLCRHCTTTTWKYLILRFVEDVNTRQGLSFSFPELWYSLLEFNSRENCQHLMNWTRWNKRDKVWSSATSLFKWRFRSRRRRCCLKVMLRDDSQHKYDLTTFVTFPALHLWPVFTYGTNSSQRLGPLLHLQPIPCYILHQFLHLGPQHGFSPFSPYLMNCLLCS